jgi:uncharacterized protein (DUF924 family)
MYSVCDGSPCLVNGALRGQAAAVEDGVERLLSFWFAPLPTAAAELERRMTFWFGAASEEQRSRDEEIRVRFGEWIEAAARGELAAWAGWPRGRLGLVILLDQFPRNIYRGTARAFEHDPQALDLTLGALEAGVDLALGPVERIFLYMPLQHAESLAMQDRAVAMCRQLIGEAPQDLSPQFERVASSADEHRALIARFGRFPHRNAVLGRESTPAEIEYLRTARSFGQ